MNVSPCRSVFHSCNSNGSLISSEQARMSIHVAPAPARARARRFTVAVVSALALVILEWASYRVLAQTGLGSFEPGVESEIWQQLTAFGQRINPSCTNSDLEGT